MGGVTKKKKEGHQRSFATRCYRWPTVPARHGTGTVGTASSRAVPRSAVVSRLWHGHGPTTACRAVPRGTGGTIVLSRGGRRADVGARLHARRLGAEGGERTAAACATASGAAAYATAARQELRAASAVGGGGLRSGGEGRSCGGFGHQGEEQRRRGQELEAAAAGVERGGSGEERKKIRVFMFLWAVGCR
jgi:hypothetical protein